MKLAISLTLGTPLSGNVLTLASNSNYYRTASTNTYKSPDGTSYYFRP